MESRRTASRLLRAEDGAIAPTAALLMTVMIGAGALAFDYSRMVTLDTELQNAADQAALAAATQLDDQAPDGGCAAAETEASALVSNPTFFSNDGSGPAVAIHSVECDGETVRVNVVPRQISFGLASVVGLTDPAEITASARAALGGGGVCNTPPMMMCAPTGANFDPDDHVGRGLRLFDPGGPNGTWAPGAFGWLNVTQGGNNGTPAQLDAILNNHSIQECTNAESSYVDPGVAGPLIDAMNVRFDIFNGGNGSEIGQCRNNANCPTAANVGKDVVNVAAPGGNQCGLTSGNGNNGWRFEPDTSAIRAIRGAMPAAQISAMGFPRDTCHYNESAGGANCTASADPSPMPRLGDREWARQLYFGKNHPGLSPADVPRIPEIAAKTPSLTRYEVYRWEISPVSRLSSLAASSGRFNHRAPKCSNSSVDAGPEQADRRVISVAVVANCGAIQGGSPVPVEITSWADVFLVEPSLTRTVNSVTYSGPNDIYVEILGRSRVAGTQGNQGQLVLRKIPFLVE